MQEEDIEQSFDEIRSLHRSFTEDNPITYAIFIAENRDRLTEEQIVFLMEKAEEAAAKQARINKKIIEQIDNELSRADIFQKFNDSENYFRQLDKEECPPASEGSSPLTASMHSD
jgi:hypothetical protein